METGVALDIANGVARITLNRPERKNALGPPEWQSILAHAQRIAAMPETRVVVIAGAGGAFSAGGDLKTMPERLALPYEARRQQLLDDAAAMTALAALTPPLVALIDGPCAGAGLGLALLCDVRLATQRARFAAPFANVGLTADFGVSWLLPATIGRTRAEAMVLLGRTFDGDAALAAGFVHRMCVDEHDLEREGGLIIERLRTSSATAMSESKRLLRRAFETTFAEALVNEAEAQARCSRAPDAAEGVRAFAEKRAPKFS